MGLCNKSVLFWHCRLIKYCTGDMLDCKYQVFVSLVWDCIVFNGTGNEVVIFNSLSPFMTLIDYGQIDLS